MVDGSFAKLAERFFLGAKHVADLTIKEDPKDLDEAFPPMLKANEKLLEANIIGRMCGC